MLASGHLMYHHINLLDMYHLFTDWLLKTYLPPGRVDTHVRQFFWFLLRIKERTDDQWLKRGGVKEGAKERRLILISIGVSFLFFSYIFLSFFLAFLLITLSPRVEQCIFRSFKLFVRARKSNTCAETNGEVMNSKLYCCSVRQPLWSLRHFKSPCVQLLVFLLSAGSN